MTFTNLAMPTNTPLHVTIRATNNAGLAIETSSEMFYVDDTPPVLVTKPKFNSNSGTSSTYDGYQWDPSVISLEWGFGDVGSSIVKHFITIKSHHEGNVPVDSIELGNQYTLKVSLKSEELLMNGDSYMATVTACNAAGLCTNENSSELLIDHTPPHAGKLNLPMKWSNENSNISVVWSGFVDTESDIRSYHIGVGQTYSGYELSNGMIEVAHVSSPQNTQTTNIQITRNLTADETIFLSIEVESNAGLRTSISKAAVLVMALNNMKSEGTLVLIKHSCDIHYCNKDCTCAVHGGKCDSVQTSSACVDLTGTSAVLPVTDVKMGVIGKHLQFSSSISCLSSNWKTTKGSSIKAVQRYEWSFGLYNATYGSGVFELDEPKWYDNGLRTSVTHCLSKEKHLLHRQKYVAYVRAWFSFNEFATYTSMPMTIDTSPPSVKKGSFIKDSDNTCNQDLEFTTSTDKVTACWDNVFTDQQSGVFKYRVYIGTWPGGNLY